MGMLMNYLHLLRMTVPQFGFNNDSDAFIVFVCTDNGVTFLISYNHTKTTIQSMEEETGCMFIGT